MHSYAALFLQLDATQAVRKGPTHTAKVQQPITFATKEIVLLMHSAIVFSKGRVTGSPAHDICPECMPIGAGFCAASAFEGEKPSTCQVVSDSSLSTLVELLGLK